jgi:ABC-type phosphate transport system auxiliary subunit
VSTAARIGLVVLLLALSACGGGGDGGGGGGGDLQQEATEVEALLDQIEALATSATTAPELSQQLRQVRDQVQVALEEVADADAPDELATERDRLANTLHSLRTQLNRVQGQADAGDLESAQTALGGLLSIAQLRSTIDAIREGAGAG